MTRGTYHSPPCARHTWVHTEDLGYHFAAFSEESRWAAINSARFFRNPSRNCCGVMFATRCSISVCSHGCSLTVIPAPSMLAPSPQQSESFEQWSRQPRVPASSGSVAIHVADVGHCRPSVARPRHSLIRGDVSGPHSCGPCNSTRNLAWSFSPCRNSKSNLIR